MIVREVVVKNYCTNCGNIWYGTDNEVCSACGKNKNGEDTWDRGAWELNVPKCFRPEPYDFNMNDFQ